MIPYGPWVPDDPDFGNEGLISVLNALPAMKGYRSMPSLGVYSSALTARCQGSGTFKDENGNSYNYAGDATKLYSLSAATYSDVSIGGGYSTADSDNWEFTKFGNDVIATNFAENPQYITMGGANFANLTTAFKCRHIKTAMNFVFAGNTWDSTDGYVPHKLRWSAIEDHTNWTYSPNTQSGFQDFPDDGWIQAITGGEYINIYQEHAITRGTYVGGNEIMRFDKIEARGTPASESVIRVGNLDYYLGWDGFYMFDGEKSIPIGAEKVDNWFDSDIDKSYYNRVSVAQDPVNHVIMWSYPGSGSSNGTPNKIIVFNWITGAWSLIEQEHEIIANYYSEGYTLEELDAFGDLDSLPFSLDSAAWKGGTLTLAAFDTSHKLNNFSGTDMAATFETAEFQMYPGKKGTLREIRPLVDGSATHTITVATRDEQSDTESYGSAITAAPSGRYACRETGRYHRIKDVTSGSFDRAIGLDVTGIQRGSR